MKEKNAFSLSGWAMLAVQIILVLMVIGAVSGYGRASIGGFGPAVFVVILILLFIVNISGFFTLQPNQAAVMTLFGKYTGTVKLTGFLWSNPFFLKRRISLRAMTLTGEKLKVNDQNGNPIEIAIIAVWKVSDTAKALFDVQNFEEFVHIQSESATRHLASAYPYDSTDEDVTTLRGSLDKVSKSLEKELRERAEIAGVEIVEARISHLSYAPEIASAMLRRQQAQAVIEARQKIVTGAVSMVEMALNQIAEKKMIKLDDERKAAMVSNLLVVLCGEAEAQPVINAGTLYNG